MARVEIKNQQQVFVTLTPEEAHWLYRALSVTTGADLIVLYEELQNIDHLLEIEGRIEDKFDLEWLRNCDLVDEENEEYDEEDPHE